MLAKGFYSKEREVVHGGLTTQQNTKTKTLSLREFGKKLIATLDDLCSQMLAIGMPYDLYWNGDNWAIDVYINSVKYTNLKINSDMHLQGVYFLKALQEVLQFKNPVEIYPREPLKLSGEEAEKPQTQEQIENDIKELFANAKRG